MKKRRIISMICILVITTLLSMFAGCDTTNESIPIPTVEENVYIYDQDDIISDDVEETLNKILTELEEETEVEFAVISIKSLLDRSIEEYANELFNTLGIGKDDKNNGVLLLFSRTDGRVRLEIGLGLEGALNDSKCGRILDNNFVPYRENDEYTTATELTVKAVAQVIAEEYNVEIQGLEKVEDATTEAEEESEEKELPWWAWIIIIAFIILYVWISLESDGGYSGGSYHGGFSGGRSSRSSFGGGRSGGGGASR